MTCGVFFHGHPSAPGPSNASGLDLTAKEIPPPADDGVDVQVQELSNLVVAAAAQFEGLQVRVEANGT